ncbi:hypothetical protein NQD34_005192 [Periophthalmus magnuspinnatus]|nr:hypothetical protein NQD34_005192 [Periophthalmus magnuspinnatus]
MAVLRVRVRSPRPRMTPLSGDVSGPTPAARAPGPGSRVRSGPTCRVLLNVRLTELDVKHCCFCSVHSGATAVSAAAVLKTHETPRILGNVVQKIHGREAFKDRDLFKDTGTHLQNNICNGIVNNYEILRLK